MKELLQKMIIGLLKQVEEKVPEAGAFPVVYEREDVSTMNIGLSHLILKVTCIIRPIPVQFPEVLQGTSEA